MPSFSVAKSANESYTPSYIPTILITGATSGIGEAVAKSISNHLHGRGHFILVGRNRAAAESIIASLPSSAQNSTYEFIACDVTLMKNVHALAKDLLERLPKLNFLVHSAGVFGIYGLEETEEGIDKKLASRYYSRWALTHDLLPLLLKAKDIGEPASVLSILGAGWAPQVDLDNLGLKKSYSGIQAMIQSISYNDLMVAVSHPYTLFISAPTQLIYSSGIRPPRTQYRIHPHLSWERQHRDVQTLQPTL
jgi:NAD(P)-dependent dehydrogenase (short-subunit alcohol dehydrogenase family)